MERQQEPVKKIVPKDEYIKVQAVRAGTMLWGMLLVVGSAACAAATVYLCVAITHYVSGQDTDGERYAFLLALPTLFSYSLMYKLSRMGRAKIKYAGKMNNNVVPLTKATLSELPVPKSLVRPSSEPLIDLETVLLRSVSYNPITPPQQMVRPAVAPVTGR